MSKLRLKDNKVLIQQAKDTGILGHSKATDPGMEASNNTDQYSRSTQNKAGVRWEVLGETQR